MKPGRIAFGLALFTAVALAVSPATAGAGTSKYSAIRSSKGHAIKASLSRANWNPAGNMNTAVAEIGGGTFFGGRLYVPGGYTSTSLFDKAQVYTASSNTWATDSEVMPAPASLGAPGWADSGVCSDGTNMYVVNGVDGSFLYSALQIYDTTQPAGSRWSFGPNPTDGANGNFYSQDSGCAVIGNALYLFGGYGGDDIVCCQVERRTLKLDLTTGTWSNTGQLMKTARFWHAYANVPQAAIAAGGTNDLSTFNPTNTAERYQPATGWSTLTNMPQARLSPGAAIVNVGGQFKAVVFGGQTSGGSGWLASTIICTLPACATWANANKDLNTPRSYFAWGGNTAPPNAYAAGGFAAGFAFLSSAERAL